MRRLFAVVVLLVLTAPLPVQAADPPGGPGWHQLETTPIVTTSSGDLVIAAGTPGLLVGVATNGFLRIRFERGVAAWLGREITSDGGFASTLTVEVDPTFVRAFVKQLLSRVTSSSRTGGGGPGALGALGGGGVTGGGLGGTQGVNVQGDTTVTVEDRQNVVRVAAPPAAPVPDQRRGGSDVLPPPRSGAGGGGGGGTTRMIAREEHDAWLLKVLRLRPGRRLS